MDQSSGTDAGTGAGSERRPGGTVEPANRAAVAKERFQTPEAPATPGYELRDPFAEVTYQAKSFDDMVSKAEQLRAGRFHAVGADGQRTPVSKVDGVWQRPGKPEVIPPDRSTPDQDDQQSTVRQSPTVVPLTPTASPAQTPPQAAVTSEATAARIDAEAERVARIAKLQAALHERYIIRRAPVKLGDVTIGQTEYRHRGDTSRVAFTESTFRLATDTNSPSVVRSMIDVAQARNWQALRVSGNEDFKRMVWLEASLRQVKTVGYEPVPGDIELLRKERVARQLNRIEPSAGQSGTDSSTSTDKQSARGNGGRKAVLAALEAVLIAKRVPERQREAVMAAAVENLGRRLAAGEQHKIKIYDKSAPAQRPVVAPNPEAQRTRERAGPVR